MRALTDTPYGVAVRMTAHHERMHRGRARTCSGPCRLNATGAYVQDACMHCGGMASVDLIDSMLTHDDARGVGALGDSYCCACGAAVRMTAPHECICRGIFGGIGILSFGFRLGSVKEIAGPGGLLEGGLYVIVLFRRLGERDSRGQKPGFRGLRKGVWNQAPLIVGMVLARCSAAVSFRMHHEEDNAYLLDFEYVLLMFPMQS